MPEQGGTTEATLTIDTAVSPNITASAAQTSAKEELTELLRYVRQQTEAGVEGGKALVSQQAPLVAKEIVAYRQAQAGVMLFSFTLLIATATYFAKRALRVKIDTDEAAGYTFGFWITAIGTVCLFAATSPVFLKPFFAPSLVILDYIRGLL